MILSIPAADRGWAPGGVALNRLGLAVRTLLGSTSNALSLCSAGKVAAARSPSALSLQADITNDIDGVMNAIAKAANLNRSGAEGPLP